SNFAEQKSLKTGQLYRLSLFFVQCCQALLDNSSPFLKRQPSPRGVHVIGFDDLNLGRLVPVIKAPECQILPAAETPMIGILENPGFRAALARVKSVRLVKEFKKDFLHHVFRLTCVTKDPHGDFQNKAVQAIKQNRQSVLISLLKLLHHLFVSHVRFADNGDAEGGSRRFGSNLVIHGSTPSMRPNVDRIPSLQYAASGMRLYQWQIFLFPDQ